MKERIELFGNLYENENYGPEKSANNKKIQVTP